MDSNKIISDRQFGFRAKHSTIMAVDRVCKLISEAANKPASSRLIPCVITIDIRNSFNSANWDLILRILKEKNFPDYIRRIVQSYLSDRKIVIISEGEKLEYNLTSGVPQGSVLGPTLWNILYNNILNIKLPKNTYTYAYADDLVVVSCAKTIEELEINVNSTLEKIKTELLNLKLDPAPDKTEIILLSGRRPLRSPNIVFCENILECKRAVKYLGIWLDHHQNFGVHAQKTAGKALIATNNLCKILPNVNGPKQCKRKILASVVTSIIMYGIEVWAPAFKYKKYRNMIDSVLRKIALRITSAYRTVSTDAILVIAGVPPAHILATERLQIACGVDRNEARELLFTSWQKEWKNNNTTTSKWTKLIITDVKKWINRSFGDTNYFLTQFLTGHGSFGTYLEKFKLKSSSSCIYCEQTDTPRHAVFDCPRWALKRTQLQLEVGEIRPQNLINKMINSEKNWIKIVTFIEEVMKDKIKDEHLIPGITREEEQHTEQEETQEQEAQ